MKHNLRTIAIAKILLEGVNDEKSSLNAYTTINDPNYNKIFCSVSGGSDSDLILDICHKCDKDNKVSYGWFDTGLEYQAKKDHLK